MCSCVNWPRQSEASWSAHNGLQVVLQTETQGRVLSWASKCPSNREEPELRGQEKRSAVTPPPPSQHTSGDWKIWSVSPSIRAIKKVISPLPWKPRTEMWKGGNSFPCGSILMWPVHFTTWYCWEYHLVGLNGKVISSQLKTYLMTKITTIFIVEMLEQIFLWYQANAKFKSNGHLWEGREAFRVISFLVFFPGGNHGRKWNLKMSTMNDLSWILISVKFRIGVSVPSIFKHVWVFW